MDPEAINNAAAKRLNPEYKPVSPLMPGSWSDEKMHAAAMERAGFRDVTTESVRMPFAFDDATGFTDYWFANNNPVPTKFLNHWMEQGGDREELNREVEAIVRCDYGNGADLCLIGVIGVGRK